MRLLTFVAWLMLIPALLITAFLPVAGSDALYGALQDRHVDEAHTGISDADRVRINAALAEFIRGERDDLDITATVYGREQSAFNETEILHMQDVGALFDMARGVRAALLTGGFALLAVPVYRRCRQVWTGFCAALGVYAAGGAVLGIWAAVDFTAAFVWFHKVLFSNDLWLLNPRTDLLIRMLPEAFFAEIALIAVIVMALLITLTGAAAYMLFGRKKGA